MRILLSLIAFIAFEGTVIPQTLGDAYWDRIVDRADSVVISRFGADFFMKHVFTPQYSLDYIVVGEYSHMWEERDTITQVPTLCHFEYDIGFDTLHVGRMNIMFNIAPDGSVIEDEDLRGFIAHPAPLRFHTDLDGFVRLAKENGVKCDRRTAFRDMRWLPFDTTQRIHPDGIGSYELVLGKVHGKTKEKRISGTTYTYQIVDAIVFDPFTGVVLRKEERTETLKIACGVANL